jgi:hypothetical protein
VIFIVVVVVVVNWVCVLRRSNHHKSKAEVLNRVVSAEHLGKESCCSIKNLTYIFVINFCELFRQFFLNQERVPQDKKVENHWFKVINLREEIDFGTLKQ